MKQLGALVALSLTGCALIDAASAGSEKGADAARPDAKLPDGAPCSYSGVLATWNFAGETGSQVSTAAATTAPGVTAGSVSRAAALVAAAGSGSINATNWALSTTLDPTRYYTFSITPPAGCTLQVSTLAIDSAPSGTGPAGVAVATSADGFVQTYPVPVGTAGNSVLSLSGVSATLELRIYGFAAASTSGSLRVQNTLSISGAVQ